MNPIQGLMMKDYRISRWLFYTSLVVFLLFMAFGFGLSAYSKQQAGTLPIFIISAFVLIFFAPIMMLSMLRIEGKNQLWLYSPRSSLTLLLSKFAVILSYQLVIQILLTIYAIVSMYLFGRDAYVQLGVGNFIKAISFLNLGLLLIGLYLSCWVTFYWIVYHSLTRYPKIKSFRWIIIILIFLAYNWFETLMLKIDFLYDFMMKYELREVLPIPNLKYEAENWSVSFTSMEPIPIAPLIYYVLLSIILVLLAARLLERKVEV